MNLAGPALAIVAFLVMVACGGGPADGGAPTTPTAAASPVATVTPAPGHLQARQLTVSSGGGATRPIVAEIARTESERETGLMNRKTMGEDEGMLFLFPAPDIKNAFWMKDTILPLTIAFLDANGRIVDTRDGTPFDQTYLYPSAPYRNVLEMNQGWFQRHGFGVGSVVSIPGDISAE